MYPVSAAAVQMLRLRSAAAAATSATRAISTNRRQRNTASVERAESISDRDKFLHYNTEEGYYKTSPYDPIKVPNLPLHEYVWRDFKKWENSVAAVSRDPLKSLHYLYACKSTTFLGCFLFFLCFFQVLNSSIGHFSIVFFYCLRHQMYIFIYKLMSVSEKTYK